MLSSDFRKRGEVTVFAVWVRALQVGFDFQAFGQVKKQALLISAMASTENCL